MSSFFRDVEGSSWIGANLASFQLPIYVEVEGFFNLLFAHVTRLWPEPAVTQEKVSPLLATISSSSVEAPVVKYRMCAFMPLKFTDLPSSDVRAITQQIFKLYRLSNLFNALPRTSSLRFEVYTAILSAVSSNKDIDVLQISKSSVDTWLKEWDVTEEQKSNLLKSIGDTFLSASRLYASRIHIISRWTY